MSDVQECDFPSVQHQGTRYAIFLRVHWAWSEEAKFMSAT